MRTADLLWSHSHFTEQVTEGKGLAKLTRLAKGRASVQTQAFRLLIQCSSSPQAVSNVIQPHACAGHQPQIPAVPSLLTCLPSPATLRASFSRTLAGPAASPPPPCPSLQPLQGPGTHLVLLEAHVALFLVPGEGLAAAPNILTWPHPLYKIGWEEANPVTNLALGMRLA